MWRRWGRRQEMGARRVQFRLPGGEVVVQVALGDQMVPLVHDDHPFVAVEHHVVVPVEDTLETGRLDIAVETSVP